MKKFPTRFLAATLGLAALSGVASCDEAPLGSPGVTVGSGGRAALVQSDSLSTTGPELPQATTQSDTTGGKRGGGVGNGGN
jgi:hypothetical protein